MALNTHMSVLIGAPARRWPRHAAHTHAHAHMRPLLLEIVSPRVTALTSCGPPSPLFPRCCASWASVKTGFAILW